MTVALVGQRPSTADFMNTNLKVVSPEYFATMGMVNQAFVRRFFPNTDPLGQGFGAGPPQRVADRMFEIMGVVSDAKYRSMRADARARRRGGGSVDAFAPIQRCAVGSESVGCRCGIRGARGRCRHRRSRRARHGHRTCRSPSAGVPTVVDDSALCPENVRTGAMSLIGAFRWTLPAVPVYATRG
jgi:hypothetical protein